ncbi:MAG: T9SS type A sorting domain-containing protein, partial [Flavobacteriia bacterium]|nr:T9SS type A sorting domain-containing protein [Flavobacteriia bacterium]
VDSTQLVNNVINIDLFNSEEYDYLTWDFGDGTQLSALLLTQSFEYEYNNPGFYDISLIFSKGICTDTTTFNLYVGAGLKLSENEENTLFQLYPNPNNGTFTLQQEFGNEIGLKLINSLGSIIYKKESLKQSEKISLSLDSGLYFLLLENDAEIYQQKMIVK